MRPESAADELLFFLGARAQFLLLPLVGGPGWCARVKQALAQLVEAQGAALQWRDNPDLASVLRADNAPLPRSVYWLPLPNATELAQLNRARSVLEQGTSLLLLPMTPQQYVGEFVQHAPDLLSCRQALWSESAAE